MKRALAFAAALCLAAVALTASADALEGGKITIRAEPGPPVKQKGGPLPVNESGSVFHGPKRCRTLPYCETFDLEVILPEGYDEDTDEFYIEISLAWDDRSVDGQAQGNDLDMYIYDISGKEDDDPNDGVIQEREVANSATSAQPERARLFQPDNGAYAIVVYNWVGVNLEYELTLEYKSAAIVSPDEYYPDASEGPKLAAGEDRVEESDSTEEEGTDFIGDSALPPVDEEPVSSAPLTGGEEFGGLFGDDEFAFDDEEAPVDDAVLGSFSNRGGIVLGPPKPVSGAVLVVWMVLAPLALATGTFFFMWRRRPAALAMDFGSAA